MITLQQELISAQSAAAISNDRAERAEARAATAEAKLTEQDVQTTAQQALLKRRVQAMEEDLVRRIQLVEDGAARRERELEHEAQQLREQLLTAERGFIVIIAERADDGERRVPRIESDGAS